MDDNGPKTQASRNADGRREPIRVVLTAHRSLGPRGFLLLMGFLSAVSFAAGIAFLMMGAWPVMGFFGLDILAIYVAFRLNYRAGRYYETVEIDPDLLRITRFHPSGEAERFDFNPYWLRVELGERPDGRTALALRQHDRLFAFGTFLTDEERREVADVVRTGLRQVRASTGF